MIKQYKIKNVPYGFLLTDVYDHQMPKEDELLEIENDRNKSLNQIFEEYYAEKEEKTGPIVEELDYDEGEKIQKEESK